MGMPIRKLLRISIYIILLFYVIIVIYHIPMIKSSPDSRLYIGLAENIISGTGYIDNIRNDNILPPVGHPLLLSIYILFSDNVLFFTRFFIFISLFILTLAAHKTLPSNWAIVLSFFLPLMVWKQQVWIAGGIESSIFFINSLLMLNFVNIFKSSKSVYDYRFVLVGILIFLSFIIRPILWPGLVLAIPVSLIIFLKIKEKAIIRKIFFLLILPAILYQSLGFISVGLYGDKRLTNGTYSGITLYSAYNEYIDLTRPYSSKLFKDKSDAEVNIIYSDETWQERDVRLKEASIDFVKKYPKRAIKGYLWRLGAFTLNNKYYQYNVLMLLWIVYMIVSVKYLKRNPWIIAFSLFLPFYYIGVTSIFVYTGARYLIAIIPLLLGSVLLLNNIIFKNLKKN